MSRVVAFHIEIEYEGEPPTIESARHDITIATPLGGAYIVWRGNIKEMRWEQLKPKDE